jgi:two-component system response regulator (stage 0 sporulation protein F)
VLIADDDNNSRMMLAFLLSSEGWQVTEACDGKEALEKMIEEKPQILLLDNRMPELTGAMVYQQLCERDISTSVILMTAYSDGKDLALSLGIRYFLRKPVDFPQLLATLDLAYQDYLSKN